ncbi:hypothetical protein Tco_0101214, partial [Tanacetum coccineum]
MTDGASTTIVVRVKASFRQGVNLQSGEVVVGGKRQKVQRRRRREVEHEEDPPSSPPNPYCEVVTLYVGEGASGFVRTEQNISFV